MRFRNTLHASNTQPCPPHVGLHAMNPRLAVVRDFRAENWPSMDLCADQLLSHLRQFGSRLDCVEIAPPFQKVLSRISSMGRLGLNADRLLNRHVLLAHSVRRAVKSASFFHVADHSYAHLVHALPPLHTGVYCHDLDAFGSLLEPKCERRPWWFRALASRTLNGLKQAAVVFYSTQAVRDRLITHQIVQPDRLVHAPYGVAEDFTNQHDDAATSLFNTDSPYLLHVGANIPRKRLDVLLDVFARVRNQIPNLRLVQVGGPWPPHLEARIKTLDIGPYVAQRTGISRPQLADLYRKASLVLVTSESEGFGLPVIEALACGAIVIASDIPALREAGAAAAIFRPCGNVAEWTCIVTQLLHDPTLAPSLESRLAHAAQFSWQVHAQIIGETYLSLHAGRWP